MVVEVLRVVVVIGGVARVCAAVAVVGKVRQDGGAVFAVATTRAGRT